MKSIFEVTTPSYIEKKMYDDAASIVLYKIQKIVYQKDFYIWVDE
jgi:hypothetical protein